MPTSRARSWVLPYQGKNPVHQQLALAGLHVTLVVCLSTDDELRWLPDYTGHARAANIQITRFPIRDGGTAADDELVYVEAK